MSYRKGYAAELELVHTLSRMGWMVVRTPKSGKLNLASPDVIAAKDGRLVVIECKSRKAGFRIEKDQLDQLEQWQNKAHAKAYVAWKISHKGWHFLKLADVIINNGNIGKKFTQATHIKMEDI